MVQERKNNLITLKLLIKRLQNHLQRLISLRTFRGSECEELGTDELVLNDVKEGHFTIVVKNEEDEKLTRFVVELCVLKHPEFLRLLKMAEEEYGFQQKGALSVPCGPEELRKILQDNEGKCSVLC